MGSCLNLTPFSPKEKYTLYERSARNLGLEILGSIKTFNGRSSMFRLAGMYKLRDPLRHQDRPSENKTKKRSSLTLTCSYPVYFRHKGQKITLETNEIFFAKSK